MFDKIKSNPRTSLPAVGDVLMLIGMLTAWHALVWWPVILGTALKTACDFAAKLAGKDA